MFFALNRPNYARWGTLFLQDLRKAGPEFREILERGAFTIRCTKKNYSRSAVDLSLEQTINRDASSSSKGIVAFRNSDSAMRRWAVSMSQRAMAVTELRSFVGLDLGETPAVQCRPSRISCDNKQMGCLSAKIDELCNPFAPDGPTSLVNLTTGRSVSYDTQNYLLKTLQRGREQRQPFQDE